VLVGHGFLYLLLNTYTPARLARRAGARDERAWEILDANGALRDLTGAQRTQLLSYLEPVDLTAGEAAWTCGDPVRHALLLDGAQVVLEGESGRLEPFTQGALLAEIDAMRAGTPHATSARVVSSGRVHRALAADFSSFLAENPGVLLQLVGTCFVE
jgi:hypothetical protein